MSFSFLAMKIPATTAATVMRSGFRLDMSGSPFDTASDPAGIDCD
jgi:hypothetical protein